MGELMSRVNICGILVDVINIAQACDITKNYIEQNKMKGTIDAAKMVQAINTDFIVRANSDKETELIANSADLALADGMPVVWASKLFNKSLPERIGGPDYFQSFSRISNTNKYSYYLLGSTEATVKKIITKLNKEYPDIAILGYECPPFSDMKNEEENIKLCERINKYKPDVLWVSFGCPKQEVWIAQNKCRIKASVAVGVGAAFEYYAGNLKRAPKFIQKLGFEWLYRLIQEPKRLWKRYLIKGPLFLKYCLKYKKSKDSEAYEIVPAKLINRLNNSN
jgi:N-acetylglucosaminyldiphosphoundecaprenol N-acetyl-beta-D-mannosaminyltransferase